MNQSIEIKLPYKKQTVIIGSNFRYEYLEKYIEEKGYDKILVLIDENARETMESGLLYLKNNSSTIEFFTNELQANHTFKEIGYFQFVVEEMYNYGLTRSSCIVCIGGGFVSDMGGFLAGTYMRGIDFIQIGTTLMAQADSVIGKVAINIKNKKNLLGLFYSPSLTICDLKLLETLPYDEAILASSEIIKHLLLSCNSVFEFKKEVEFLFDSLKEAQDDYQKMRHFIYLSLLTKKRFVEKDPYDKNGGHKALSLGHTFANILETLFKNMRHGEAVRIGLYLSLEASILAYPSNQNEFSSIQSQIEKIYPIRSRLEYLKFEDIINLLKTDKISVGGKINFVLLTKIGDFSINDSLTNADIYGIFSKYFKLS